MDAITVAVRFAEPDLEILTPKSSERAAVFESSSTAKSGGLFSSTIWRDRD
jgi:hypothetical protein